MYIPVWIIALIAIVIGFLIFKKKKKKNFAPFFVNISPKWLCLLKDYNLIDEQKWKKIQSDNNEEYYNYEKQGVRFESLFNILNDGITFSVLQSEEDSELVYYNSRHIFRTEVDFREPIEKLGIGNDVLWTYTPKLYVKSSLIGYIIGITTPESSKKVIMAGDGNDEIAITTLPYALFHMPRYRCGVLKHEQLLSLLKKHGWTENKLDSEERLSGYFSELDHKYFKVTYKHI